MKYCAMCKETLSFDKFSINKKRKDGLQCYCKKCNSEINIFYKDRKKLPKDKRTCKLDGCEITFETRNKDKNFCCKNHSQKYHNKIKNNDKEYRFKYEFKAKFQRKKEPKLNNYKKWTEQEDILLIQKKDEGLIYKEIAILLGRSSDSCQSRYKLLSRRIKI